MSCASPASLARAFHAPLSCNRKSQQHNGTQSRNQWRNGSVTLGHNTLHGKHLRSSMQRQRIANSFNYTIAHTHVSTRARVQTSMSPKSASSRASPSSPAGPGRLPPLPRPLPSPGGPEGPRPPRSNPPRPRPPPGFASTDANAFRQLVPPPPLPLNPRPRPLKRPRAAAFPDLLSRPACQEDMRELTLARTDFKEKSTTG